MLFTSTNAKWDPDIRDKLLTTMACGEEGPLSGC